MAERRFRILSMDGGTSLLVYTRLLRDALRVVRKDFPEGTYPGFLKQMDLACGSSAGAACATFLSVMNERHPGVEEEDMIMEELVSFADALIEFCGMSAQQALRTLKGKHTTFSVKEVRDFFHSHYGDVKMKDLEKRVALLSYRIKREQNAIPLGTNSYPTLFTQHDGYVASSDEQPESLSAVDATIQSCGFPIEIPIWQNHVDGAFVTNNPTMPAITRIVKEARDGKVASTKGLTLDNMVALSLGTDVPDLGAAFGPLEPPADETWGWIKWIGPNWLSWLQQAKSDPTKLPEIIDELIRSVQQDPRQVALAVSVYYNGVGQGGAMMCEQLLPEGQFLRLAIPTEKALGPQLVLMFFDQYKVLSDDARDAAIAWGDPENPRRYQPNLTQTVEWLRTQWF